MRGRDLWFLLFILSCILFGKAWEEARAYLDEFGRLHWGGEIFEEEVQDYDPDSTNPETSKGLSGKDELSCPAGASISVWYGGSYEDVVLEAALQAGRETVLSCSAVS
jgi:hypothetical protein